MKNMKGVQAMNIDTNTVVSMTEANQNFSKVTRVVDHYGRAVIFKNNVPRYMVIDFPIADKIETALTKDVLTSSSRIMELYDDAFKELAKWSFYLKNSFFYDYKQRTGTS